MRIALINPITQTVDRPKHFRGLFSRRPKEPLRTDAEINIVKLGQAMADLGHDVTLFISDCFRPRTPYVPPKNSFQIRYLPTRVQSLFSPSYLPLLPSLYGEIKKGGFDVIQSSELTQPSTWMAALTGKPLFVWEEVDRYFSRWIPRLAQKISHRTAEAWLKKRVTVIPRSHAAAEFLKERGWQKMASPIPTPVDTELFRPLENADEKYLLTVTRLAPDRGLSFLLELMESLCAARPDLKLVVVGGGNEEDAFRREILERNLTQNIELIPSFLSHRELNRVYNDSMMTLITTLGGLYPFTASESMACGKPVVSRFKRGLKDIIEEGKTGYLAEAVEVMREKIVFLLDNPEKQKQMGAAARRRAMEMNFKAIAGRFLRQFEDS